MLSHANYSTWKKGAASPKLSSAHFSASGREIKTRLCFCLFIFLLRSPRHTVFSSFLIYFSFEWKRRQRQLRLGSASPSSRMTYHRWQRRIWDGCEWRREGRRHEYREGKKVCELWHDKRETIAHILPICLSTTLICIRRVRNCAKDNTFLSKKDPTWRLWIWKDVIFKCFPSKKCIVVYPSIRVGHTSVTTLGDVSWVSP